tara:strand:- start:347 stop:580 length:234 start_codon:yes stop_codon:yes gene_type:complete
MIICHYEKYVWFCFCHDFSAFKVTSSAQNLASSENLPSQFMFLFVCITHKFRAQAANSPTMPALFFQFVHFCQRCNF